MVLANNQVFQLFKLSMKSISTFTSTFTKENKFSKPGDMKTDFLFDKTTEPDERKVIELLADKALLWIKLKTFLIENVGPVREEWKFYSAKYGWTMKVLLGKRNLFFMKPGQTTFLVGFVFGDKAVSEVEKSDLPENIKTELSEAKKYMEGRGLQVVVKTAYDLETVIKLVAIKVKN
jgi:hypothetical protein